MSCMLPALSSFCLAPTQIWYTAVHRMADSAATSPATLVPTC